MKKTIMISLLIWGVVINIGRLWPSSKGERYYRNLQKWYALANEGGWNKANIVAQKLKEEDTRDFIQKNRSEELQKKLGQLAVKGDKSADDWMETAMILYKLGQKEQAYKAVESAYKKDPIREDVSKIYFTFRSSLLR